MKTLSWPKRMWILLAALVATQIISAADLKTIVDLEGEGVRYRSIIGQPDRTEFANMVAEFLGPREVKLGAIAVYGSLRDRVLIGPRGEDHCGYETWRALIDQIDLGNTKCPEVQEAIKIGDEIVIRSLDHNCRRSLSVLGKTNPLDLSVAGNNAKVLELSFSRPMGKQNTHRIAADLYVRTREPVSKELAEAVTAHVKSMTGARYLGVILRSDTWFLTDCSFPAFYPFEDRPSKIPNKEEFHSMKDASCFVSVPWPIRCSEGAPRP